MKSECLALSIENGFENVKQNVVTYTENECNNVIVPPDRGSGSIKKIDITVGNVVYVGVDTIGDFLEQDYLLEVTPRNLSTTIESGKNQLVNFQIIHDDRKTSVIVFKNSQFGWELKLLSDEFNFLDGGVEDPPTANIGIRGNEPQIPKK